MNQAQLPDDEQHDASLLRWMLTLTPQQRLAELESRLAFFYEARRNGFQLSDDQFGQERWKGPGRR